MFISVIKEDEGIEVHLVIKHTRRTGMYLQHCAVLVDILDKIVDLSTDNAAFHQNNHHICRLHQSNTE